jgi:hypothetical protein
VTDAPNSGKLGSTARTIRRGAILTALGLMVQLMAGLRWTPITFILSAAVGLPLVLLGALFFFRGVWGILRAKDAL